MMSLVVMSAVDALYEANSKLALSMDFGEFHPAFLDATAPIILESNKEHMDLIHDVYGA